MQTRDATGTYFCIALYFGIFHTTTTSWLYIVSEAGNPTVPAAFLHLQSGACAFRSLEPIEFLPLSNVPLFSGIWQLRPGMPCLPF